MTEDKRSIIQMVAGLIEQGKKNQDKIAYSKILDTFSGVEISSEQFDNILKVLEDNKIEVLRSKNDMEQTVSLSAKEKEPLTIQPYFRDPVIPIFFLLWILVNHCVCLSTEWELCRIIATFVKLPQQNFGF